MDGDTERMRLIIYRYYGLWHGTAQIIGFRTAKHIS